MCICSLCTGSLVFLQIRNQTNFPALCSFFEAMNFGLNWRGLVLECGSLIYIKLHNKSWRVATGIFREWMFIISITLFLKKHLRLTVPHLLQMRAQMYISSESFFRKGFYLFIFRQRGREGERKGEKHWSVASCRPQTRNQILTPGMCSDQNQTGDLSLRRMTPNPLSHAGQGFSEPFDLKLQLTISWG